jgi:hypothetical protein
LNRYSFEGTGPLAVNDCAAAVIVAVRPLIEAEVRQQIAEELRGYARTRAFEVDFSAIAQAANFITRADVPTAAAFRYIKRKLKLVVEAVPDA